MSDELGWPFDVLGLEDRNPDKKTIRKAYAKKLKSLDQDKDPRAFEELRSAFEAAQARVARDFVESDSPTPPNESVIDGGEAGAIHTHYREAFPLPETPVGLDPTSAFDVPYADETPEFQLSPEVEALLAKVNTRVAGQSDAARLSEIIDDPLLNDPRAEAILEQEIFYYLLEQIEFDERSQRSWLMLDDGKGNSATSMEVEVDNLLIKADQAFGWLSDQVGSQHKFPAYSVFIESLGKGEFIPESEPDESSQPVLKTILIWVLIFASVTGLALVFD